jgi:hypothetical protein
VFPYISKEEPHKTHMLATNFSKISMDANPEIAPIHPYMSVMFL